MGQTGSKVASKLVNSFSFTGAVSEEEILENIEKCDGKTLERFRGSAPLVYSRRGSMYFDEDGDLAHEFYEEVMPKKGKGRRKMKRIPCKFLTPQGDIPYQSPRIHVDFPVILHQG